MPAVIREFPGRSRVRVAALFVIAAFSALAALAGPALGAEPDQLSIESLSSRPDMVSDGDALVEVNVPASAGPGGLTVTVDGVNRTAGFTPVGGDSRRLRSLVGHLVRAPTP